MKRYLWLLLLLLLPATVARGEEVELTLRDCLERAMVAALEIREGRHIPRIAETRIAEEVSEFDHLFNFRAAGGQSKRESGNQLGGAEEIREQRFDGEIGISQRTVTGGIYTFGFQTNDTVTNSSFFTKRPLWTSGFLLSVNQPILRTGWQEYNESRTRLAEAELRGAREEFRSVAESTLAAVERSYWRLVYFREDLKVKRHSHRLALELLRVSQRRLDAGAGTRIELVQAEAGVAEREKDMILAEHLVQNGEDVLRSFLYPFPDDPGKEVTVVPTDGVDLEPVESKEEVWDRVSRAFDSRPDLLAAQERLEAAGIRVRQSDNELLPRLDFFGSYGYSGIDDTFGGSVKEAYSFDFPNWEVGLVLEVPLGNRGARARHRRSLLERSRAIAGFESLKNRVIVELRQAVRNTDTSRRQILASRKSTAAAEAQFEAERDRLKAEKSTNYQVLEVEQDLSRARSQELLALVSYRNSLVDLEEATGTYLAVRGLTGEPAKK